MKTFREVYEFPLRLQSEVDWVRDAKSQFVFQFEIDDNALIGEYMSIINGISKPSKQLSFVHVDGYIIDTNTLKDVILIRGWGNLTGTGDYNLSSEEASNIQDTFADYIVNQLNQKVGE